MDMATVASEKGDMGIMASTEDMVMAMATVDTVAVMAMATVDTVAVDLLIAMVAVDLLIAMVVMVATESTEAMGMDTEGMAMEVMDTMAKAFITIRAPTP